MVWVGGGILIHGLEEFGITGPGHLSHALAERAAHAVPAVGGALGWLAAAAFAGVVGLVVGFALIPLVERVLAPLAKRFRRT